MSGYIKIYRKITEWEWYSDINTARVFFHLLLKANHKDKKYKGKVVPRGSLATTIPKLAAETALTTKEVRTALNHLKSTFEVGIQTTNRESIIKVHNYSVYQGGEIAENTEAGRQGADERQSKGERTEEEGKKEKKGRKKGVSKDTPKEKPFVPPTAEEVIAYCAERGKGVNGQKVWDYYNAMSWVDANGKPVQRWKAKVISVWEKDSEEKPGKPPSNAGGFTNTSYDLEEMEQMIVSGQFRK